VSNANGLTVRGQTAQVLLTILFEERIPQRLGHWSRHMKLVMAIIKPFKLDDVREALSGLGVQGMTATEVKGFGRQKGQREIYRGSEYTVNFLPKIKVEVVVPDDMADRVVDAITATAKTGQIGDGKVFVFGIEHAVRIRTGDKDAAAL
jgi:nitrogen regulatory protein P-II 2